MTCWSGEPLPLWRELGRELEGETGEEGRVGVERGRGERGGPDEEMLRARTDAARRTIGGDGVRELSGSKVQCMIV